jgi:PleD family two-component response regulator
MVIAVVDDLLFSSKIRSIADQAGREVKFLRQAGGAFESIATERPSLVILDLDREALDPIGLVRAIRADAALRSIRLAAFVRHTSAGLIKDAREAGVDLVLARSAFFPALAEMLAEDRPATS